MQLDRGILRTNYSNKELGLASRFSKTKDIGTPGFEAVNSLREKVLDILIPRRDLPLRQSRVPIAIRIDARKRRTGWRLTWFALHPRSRLRDAKHSPSSGQVSTGVPEP